MGKVYKTTGSRVQRANHRRKRMDAQQKAADEQWLVFQEMLASGEFGRCSGVIIVPTIQDIPVALDTLFHPITTQSQQSE